LLTAATACGGGGDPGQAATAVSATTQPASATPTRPPTRTPTPSATATPTPKSPGPPPATRAEAIGALTAYLEGGEDGCTDAAVAYAADLWNADCVEGDFDGDGGNDFALLVPLAGGEGTAPAPAAVVARRAGAAALQLFPVRRDADHSAMGRALFEAEDRNGDGLPELAYLSTQCGASNCVSLVEVQAWDGTAWRDIGPGGAGFDNPESIAWSGAGAESVLTVRAGTLGSVGAGPTRASTTAYALEDGQFQVQSSEPDPPVFLFHAILDADALFDAGEFDGAIAAYGAAIADDELKDWREETGQGAGRPSLEGYALFRIAVATAAAGDDPTAAIDSVITGSEEPLFAEASLAFRRGYQNGGSVTRGCLEATDYFSSPAAAAILDARFDYGYGNQRKGPADMCPL
jgi:hypothetical protein